MDQTGSHQSKKNKSTLLKSFTNSAIWQFYLYKYLKPQFTKAPSQIWA